MSGTLCGEFTAEETSEVLAVVAARGTATSRGDIRGALRAATLRPERQNPYFQSVVWELVWGPGVAPSPYLGF